MKYDRKNRVYVASSPLDLIGWDIKGFDQDVDGYRIIIAKSRLSGTIRRVRFNSKALPLSILEFYRDDDDKE